LTQLIEFPSLHLISSPWLAVRFIIFIESVLKRF